MRDEQQQIQRNKSLTSLKSMTFNRFLLFRYVTAGFFFVELYWLSVLIGTTKWEWILPAVLILTDCAISVEQTSKYWYPSHRLTITKWGYWVHLVVNILLAIELFMGSNHYFFSYITKEGRMPMILLLSLGIVMITFLQARLWKIEHDQDHYLKRLEDFKKSLVL
jgi:hypothetical protein